MEQNWTKDARRRLLDQRRSSGGWGYRETTAPAVEPTALAGLSLRDTDRAVALAAADRLASIQRPDGSMGVTTTNDDEPGWPTPYACLLWAGLGGYQPQRDRAIARLLATKGIRVPLDARSPVGHDTQLVGWPWVSGTHSWLEPTAMAVLALCREGRREEARTLEGLRVIRDRAISTGGWNIGNPMVFKTALRASPAPTGIALLAMAWAGKVEEPVVGPAIVYLRRALAETLAPASLAWGILGLRAWGALPRQSTEWLALAYDQISRRPAGAMNLALLLLASDEGSLEALGITPREARVRNE